MTNIQSDYAKRIRPVPIATGAEEVTIRATVAVGTGLASGDILEFMELPEDHVPVDFIVDSDDLDSGGTPAVAISFGLLNTGKTAVSTDAADGGAAWLGTSTVAQAGGLARPTAKNVTRVSPNATTKRMVGALVTTTGATAVAGTVGFTLKYRAAHYGG